MQLPGPLIESLQGVPGFDPEALRDAHAQAPPTAIRLNPAKGMALPEGTAVPWCPGAVVLPGRPPFTLDPAFHAGAYYVQEPSSMFLHYLWKQQVDATGLRVLDLCAAPGGKTTLLASLLDSDSLLVSNEAIRGRATILEENCIKWGYTNNWVCANDPRDLGRLTDYFDAIVIDAPCSGSGLFRKFPDWTKEWSPAQVDLCAARQERILRDSWPALKPGGWLFYATCSYSPQEDEQVLDWMADELGATGTRSAVPEAWNIVRSESPRKGIECFRFFPDKVAGEGFFIAALRKPGEREDTVSAPKPSDPFGLAGWLRPGAFHFLKDREQQVCALHPAHAGDVARLEKAVYLRKTGVALGSFAGKDFLPAHPLAMSADRSPEIASIALNKKEALAFLKRETPELPLDRTGWLLATYEGLGLGWIKAMPRRYNNYFPKHWRIRMDLPDEP